MSDHTKLNRPNLWLPEANPLNICILGKLGEELNECSGRVHRSMIQGLQGLDPDDKRPNAVHLVEELADVQALVNLTNLHLFPQFNLLQEARAKAKYEHKREWIEMVRQHYGLDPLP